MREHEGNRHSRSERRHATVYDNSNASKNSPHQGFCPSPPHSKNASSRSVDVDQRRHAVNVIDGAPGEKTISSSYSHDHQFPRGRRDSVDRGKDRRRSYASDTRSFSLDGRMRMDSVAGSGGARDPRALQKSSLQNDSHRPSVLSRITYSNDSPDRGRAFKAPDGHSNMGEDERMNNEIAARPRESSHGDGHRSRKRQRSDRWAHEEHKNSRSEHSSSRKERDHGDRKRSKTPPRGKSYSHRDRGRSGYDFSRRNSSHDSHRTSRREHDSRDRERSKEHDRGDRRKSQDVTPPRHTSSSHRERGRSRNDFSTRNSSRDSYRSSRREHDSRGRRKSKEHDREYRRRSKDVTPPRYTSSSHRDRDRSRKDDISRSTTDHRSRSTRMHDHSRRNDAVPRNQLTLDHYFSHSRISDHSDAGGPAVNRRRDTSSRHQEERRSRNKQPSTDDVETITIPDSPEHRSSSLSDDEVIFLGDSSDRKKAPVDVVTISDNEENPVNKEGKDAVPFSQCGQDEQRRIEESRKRYDAFSEDTNDRDTSHSSKKMNLVMDSDFSSNSDKMKKKNYSNNDGSEASHLLEMRLQQGALNDNGLGNQQYVQKHQHSKNHQTWNPSKMDHLEQTPKATSENINLMNQTENKIGVESSSEEEHREMKKVGKETMELEQEMDNDGRKQQMDSEKKERDKIVNSMDGQKERGLPPFSIENPTTFFQSPSSLRNDYSLGFSISPFSQKSLHEDMEVADVMISGLSESDIKSDMLAQIHDPLNELGDIFNNAPNEQNNVTFGGGMEDMGFDFGNPILALNQIHPMGFEEEGEKVEDRGGQMDWDGGQVAVEGGEEMERDGAREEQRSEENWERKETDVMDKRNIDNNNKDNSLEKIKVKVEVEENWEKFFAVPKSCKNWPIPPKIVPPVKIRLDRKNPSASVVMNAEVLLNNKDDKVIVIDEAGKKDGVLKDVVNLSLSSEEDDVLFLGITQAQELEDVKPVVKKRAPKRRAVQSPPPRSKSRTVTKKKQIKEEPLDYDENLDYQLAKQLDKKENGYSLRNNRIKLERCDYDDIYGDMIGGDSDQENTRPRRSNKRIKMEPHDSDEEFVPSRYQTRRSTARSRSRRNRDEEMAGDQQHYAMNKMIKREVLSEGDLTCGEDESDELSKKKTASDKWNGLKKEVKQEVLEKDVESQKKWMGLKKVKEEIIDHSYDNSSKDVAPKKLIDLKKVKAEVVDISYDGNGLRGKVIDVIDLTKGVADEQDIKFEPLRKALKVVQGPTKPSRNKKKKDTQPKIKVNRKSCTDGLIYYVDHVVAKIREPESTADQVYIVSWVSWNDTACTLCSIDDLRGSMQELQSFKNYEIAVEYMFNKFTRDHSTKAHKKGLPMPVIHKFDLLTNTSFCKKWLSDLQFETMKKSSNFLEKIGLHWYLKCLEREWTAKIQKAQPEAGGIRIISLFGNQLEESFTNLEFSAENRYTKAAWAELKKSVVNPNCSCKCREFCDYCVRDEKIYSLGFLDHNNINLDPTQMQTRCYAALRCGPLSSCPPDAPCRKLPFRVRQVLLCDLPGEGGFGLFAVEGFEIGDVIGEYTGETCLLEEIDPEASTNYQYAISDRGIIDAARVGNETRFVNHSCSPNLGTMVLYSDNRWSFPRIYLVAKRSIKAGEQLTIDYHPSYRTDPDKERPQNNSECYCEARCCRGWL